MCHGFCLRTWTEALNSTKVDQSLELRNAEKVFYPPVIKDKVTTMAQGNVAPSAQPAYTKAFNPTSGDKASASLSTSTAKEVPASDKALSLAPQPSTEGQPSKEAEKDNRTKGVKKRLAKVGFRFKFFFLNLADCTPSGFTCVGPFVDSLFCMFINQ